MEKKVSKRIAVSFVLNALMFLILCGIAYYKREGIKRKITKLFSIEIVSEKDLKQFNKEPYSFGNGEIDIGSKKTIKILFLGNSLTYSSVPDEEPDKEVRGLTSTSKGRDYVHQLMKMLSEKKNVNIAYSVVNITSFERTFSKTAFNYRQVEK